MGQRRQPTVSLLAFAALLTLSAPALAWPVDVTVDVEAGGEKFERPSALSWVEVEDAKIATAEVLESGELLLSGISPGRTLLLLYAEGKFAVWRLRVSAKGEKPRPVPGDEALSSAKKACPGLATHPGSGDAALVGTIKDERCRKALLTLFQTDAFHAKELDLTFELGALQAQLISVQAGLKAEGLGRLESRYFGAGLVLEGKVSEAEHRKALWELFRRSAARVALEDKLEVTKGSP
ncbi:MAG: pilus assembly protein N-terminal domain-containing protein [Myxococcaceae bacterium]